VANSQIFPVILSAIFLLSRLFSDHTLPAMPLAGKPAGRYEDLRDDM